MIVEVSKSQGLSGTLKIVGDKSISHRAIMIASQALGTSRITGLLESDDVLSTISCINKLGIKIEKKDDSYYVYGNGIRGLSEPDDVLYVGNSGTSARLLVGLVASYGFNIFFSGDASLNKRPMGRIIDPLSKMNVNFVSTSNRSLPLVVQGNQDAIPADITLDIPSAQVKSSILLCALNIAGTTTVLDAFYSRDHTERMLAYFGADIHVKNTDNGNLISINGDKELEAREVEVPGDFSSAAFLIASAIITPGSRITIKNVCVNSTRIGLYSCLLDMNANLVMKNKRNINGEPVADIEACYSSELQGINIPSNVAPSMIDEYPILAVIAATAKGRTIMNGIDELKVKESNRLDAIVNNLSNAGVRVENKGDSIVVEGSSDIIGGNLVKTNLDHRIAMSFIVLGLVAKNSITIDDVTPIATSFPNFIDMMKEMKANIS